MTYSEQIEMERLQNLEERFIIYGRSMPESDKAKLERLESKYFKSIQQEASHEQH